jgi:serine/threonine protein kinase
MTLQTGDRLGAYEIRGPLGAGGMGEVYRAWDARLGREVAVKVLPQSSATNPERLHRFEQEAKAAARNHPKCWPSTSGRESPRHRLGTAPGDTSGRSAAGA